MAEDERIPIPIGAGAVAGIVAWLVGYAVTYAVAVDAVHRDLRELGLDPLVDDVPDWQFAGWLYYNAHGVDVRFPGVGVAVPDGNLLGGDSWFVYLVPAVVLVLAGAVVTWRHRRAYARRTDAAMAGATAFVGYLGCSVVGLVAVAAGVGDAVVRPDALAGVVLAGVAYPVAFGSLGGLLAYAIASSDSSDDPG